MKENQLRRLPVAVKLLIFIGAFALLAVVQRYFDGFGRVEPVQLFGWADARYYGGLWLGLSLAYYLAWSIGWLVDRWRKRRDG